MPNELKNKILSRQAHIGIIGLGYVGLPLVLRFVHKGFRVLGFDTDPQKVAVTQCRAFLYQTHPERPDRRLPGARQRGGGI